MYIFLNKQDLPCDCETHN